MMSLSSPSVRVWVFLIIVSVTQGETLTSPCTSVSEVLSHPTDCTRYLQCVNGQPLDRACAPGTVFSTRSRVCVLPWDRMHPDDVFLCTVCPPDQVSSVLQLHRAVNSHPLPQTLRQGVEEDYLYECPYPQLFNEVTLRCEDYRHVQCGQRFLPLGACEYTKNQCQFSHCTPCDFYSPSCRGLADGMNVHSLRMWSPYFAVCKDQRLVNTSTCPGDRVSDRQLFSPDLGRCANLYEIPVEHGGYFLNCTGRADGLYLDDVTNRPDLYFRCTSGARTEIFLCPYGQYFDVISSSCLSRV